MRFPDTPAQTPATPDPPSSGYRVPLSSNIVFPSERTAGRPPFHDADGVSPVFIGSAIFDDSVHPCKIVPTLDPKCMVPYGGTEHHHYGRYDLLPFDPTTMEFVRTSHGHIPQGRRPVEGGYEDNGMAHFLRILFYLMIDTVTGNKLYHGIGDVGGVMVPGKAGTHLGGCNVSFGGKEHIIRENYDILCWR
ncbi:hypothetical protein D9757_008040 [Collybiopsis confluens]|uniref:Uncharacterized protein n=1 Tax=Collybiopsis confluens TaxID=2823264 RepID=A0A8H5H5X9_9AGAR|nr:hypothetical protein D9757_008040 [Collybiopsis confluens]